MEAKIFYASGARGNEVRADGSGGLLARGWYARVNGQRHGPFSTEAKAKAAVADAVLTVSASQTVIIGISGVKGDGSAMFPAHEWDGMAPAARVLAIHAQRRDLTDGLPFDIGRITRA